MPKIFLGTAGVDGTSVTEDRLPHHKQVEARLRAPLEATEAFIKLAVDRVTANVSSGSSAAPRPGGPDLEQRVRSLMARGEISRAGELLSQEGSPGPTLLDESGVDLLQALHPPPPPPARLSQGRMRPRSGRRRGGSRTSCVRKRFTRRWDPLPKPCGICEPTRRRGLMAGVWS